MDCKLFEQVMDLPFGESRRVAFLFRRGIARCRVIEVRPARAEAGSCRSSSLSGRRTCLSRESNTLVVLAQALLRKSNELPQLTSAWLWQPPLAKSELGATAAGKPESAILEG